MKVLREVARRVTLTDLVEDMGEAREAFKSIDNSTVRRAFLAGAYVRTGMRSALRVLGDYILINGLYDAYQDQENALTQIVLSAGISGFAYLMDYIGFERLAPAPWKKDDAQ